MPSALLNNEAADNNYDVIIVGGSHAGLSAALTLYRALHRCVIFDSSKPRDTSGAPVHLTSAWDGADAEKLKDAQVSELKSTGLIDFVSRAVVSAKKQSDGTFEVVDDRNVLWRGKKMLLAIGMQEVFPDIAGYAENYGSTVFNCMFSFGYEQRGSPSAGLLASGALANPMHATSNVKDALKFVDYVTVYTDGNKEVHQTLSNSLIEGMNIDTRRISKIRADQGSSGIFLDLEDGQSHQVAFLVHKPDMILASDLVTDLGLETIPGMGIKVRPPFNETSVDGVFAAGDCCSMMRIIPNAWSMGASAGCGLAKQLPKSVWRKNGSQ